MIHKKIKKGFKKLGNWVDDTFLGGEERKAGKEISRGYGEAAKRTGELRNRLLGYYKPYYEQGARSFKEFSRDASQRPSNFIYRYRPPSFSYNRNMPEFQERSRIAPQEFAYEETLPEFQERGRFSFSPDQIESNPSYQFRLQQGLKALDRANAARGFRGSGNRLIDLVNYAQGLASTEYENEFRRQLAADAENYARGAREYEYDYGREQDLYRRALGEDELNYARSLQANMENYARGAREYEYDYGREQDIYRRALGEYGLDYQREGDIYSRALQQDILNYERGQNYLNRLLQVAGLGMKGVDAYANADAMTTETINNALIMGRGAKVSGRIARTNVLRNTIEDVASAIGERAEKLDLSKILLGIV